MIKQRDQFESVLKLMGCKHLTVTGNDVHSFKPLTGRFADAESVVICGSTTFYFDSELMFMGDSEDNEVQLRPFTYELKHQLEDPAGAARVNVAVELTNDSIWIDVAVPPNMPGDADTDVARVRLELWDSSFWLRAWRGQETESDPYLNELLHPTGGDNGQES